MKNNLVVKKNPLVNAKYKLNPLEIKIVLTVVSLIEKDDSDFWTYQVRVSDLGSDYKELQRASRSLMKRIFEIEDEKGWVMMPWFSYLAYKKREGVLECRFDPALKPYLLQIKDNFTAYRLKSILSMRSTYSIRLYEMLKQYEQIGSRVFNLDELQDLLQVPKSYRIWRAFSRRVLEQSLKEINHYSDLEISFDTIRQGRKITAISFKIAPKLQKLSLSRYKALVRAKCVNKTLLETQDKKTGNKIELSVSEKGYLYNKLDPRWKINQKRADEIWQMMLDKQICFEFL